MFLSFYNVFKVSTTFYVVLLAMHLLSLNQLHTSCHIGTLPWALIVHNFQQSPTCSNKDKSNSRKVLEQDLVLHLYLEF